MKLLLIFFTVTATSVFSQNRTSINKSYVETDSTKTKVRSGMSTLSIEKEGGNTTIKSETFGGIKEDIRKNKKENLEDDIIDLGISIKDQKNSRDMDKLTSKERALKDLEIEKLEVKKMLSELDLGRMNKLIQDDIDDLSFEEKRVYETKKSDLEQRLNLVNKKIFEHKNIDKTQSDYQSMGTQELSLEVNKLEGILLAKKTNQSFNLSRMSANDKQALQQEILKIEENIRLIREELKRR